jgi:hypothetical protein
MASPRGPYYVEFRARTGGVLGHAYIVYGRLDGRGRAAETRYAGLYPNDEYDEALLTFGPLVIVPAHIGDDEKDHNTRPSARYRRSLTPEQFARLQVALNAMRTRKQRWHLIFHNCNDFVGQMARQVGLWVPLAWGPPDAFVNGLRALNGP